MQTSRTAPGHDDRGRRAPLYAARPWSCSFHPGGPCHAGPGLGDRSRSRAGTCLPGTHGQPPAGRGAPAGGTRHCRGDLRADLNPEMVIDLFLGPIYYRLFLSGSPLDEAFEEQLVAALHRHCCGEWG
ncbi:TetR-like C-terminal domain-containing protein [Streptomyces sp. NPDC002205]|uniref:TetR-like C-terminal domain-containing protein n=1 Tax=Streptomyces sp. NPDC002205 TaxID=3154411 RepID=UPI0033186102